MYCDTKRKRAPTTCRYQSVLRFGQLRALRILCGEISGPIRSARYPATALSYSTCNLLFPFVGARLRVSGNPLSGGQRKPRERPDRRETDKGGHPVNGHADERVRQ